MKVAEWLSQSRVRRSSARIAKRACLIGALAIAAACSTAGRSGAAVTVSSNIHDYVDTSLQDFSAYVHLVKYDADAARRINKDFGLIYEWMRKARGDLFLRYKEPDQFRLDGRFGASHGTWVVNGTMQTVRLSLGLNVRTPLGDTPGKRKTLLDVGLISDDYLSYTNAQFQGARPFNGVECAVFRITYRSNLGDSSHRIVWIDPRTRVTLRREEYSQEGKLVSIWYYHNPTEVAHGIYLPSEVEVDDATGKLAGETAYRDIKVNQGVSNKLFE